MHHAFLLIGRFNECLSCIPEEDQTEGPDVRFFVCERFGIDEARALKHEAGLRPLTRAYRTFVISPKVITPEAQNALLKLFEEPSPTARFYLHFEKEDALLPTLLSRLMPLEARKETAEITPEARAFLNMEYRERLEEAVQRAKEKDTAWQSALLNGLEVWAEEREDRTALEAVLFVRTYAGRPGASFKMLLEYLALSLPASVQMR